MDLCSEGEEQEAPAPLGRHKQPNLGTIFSALTSFYYWLQSKSSVASLPLPVHPPEEKCWKKPTTLQVRENWFAQSFLKDTHALPNPVHGYLDRLVSDYMEQSSLLQCPSHSPPPSCLLFLQPCPELPTNSPRTVHQCTLLPCPGCHSIHRYRQPPVPGSSQEKVLIWNNGESS